MDIFNAIGWPIAIPNMQRTIHVKENYENEILQLYNVNDWIRHDRQKQLGYALNIADIVLHIL